MRILTTVAVVVVLGGLVAGAVAFTEARDTPNLCEGATLKLERLSEEIQNAGLANTKDGLRYLASIERIASEIDEGDCLTETPELQQALDATIDNLIELRKRSR